MNTLFALLLVLQLNDPGWVASMARLPVAATSSAPTPDILWWKLNEGDGTSITGDGTNGGDDATTDADWVTGKSGSGYALDFNGSSDDLQSNSNITFGTNIVTATLWLNPSTVADTRILLELSANVSANTPTFAYYLESSKITAAMVEVDGTTKYRIKQIPFTLTDQWTHIAIVFDSPASSNSGEITVYTNAVESAGSYTLSTKTLSSNFKVDKINVGARNKASLWLDGSIDDVRIYSGSLTQGQIQSVMEDPQ